MYVNNGPSATKFDKGFKHQYTYSKKRNVLMVNELNEIPTILTWYGIQ